MSAVFVVDLSAGFVADDALMVNQDSMDFLDLELDFAVDILWRG